jgi:hypothetical protein
LRAAAQVLISLPGLLFSPGLERRPPHDYNYAHTLLAQGEYPELDELLKRATGQYGNISLSARAHLVPDTARHTNQAISACYTWPYLRYSFAYFLIASMLLGYTFFGTHNAG